MNDSPYSPELADELARNETLMKLTRNALMVAGQEMGEDGDHWPALRAMIAGVEEDHNTLQNELIIQEQIKKATAAYINELATKIPEMIGTKQVAAKKILREMIDLYDASFGEVPAHALELSVAEDDREFKHWRSADILIEQLGDKA